MSRLISTLVLVSVALAFGFLFFFLDLQPVEGSILSAVKRPIRNVYEKASSIKDRVSSRIHRRSRYSGRSASDATGASGPRVRASGRAASESPSNDFAASCFLERGPNFKKAPTLYFYAYDKHTDETRACGEAEQLDLEPLDGELDADEPQLNVSAIKEQIFDTHMYQAQQPTYLLVHGFLAKWNGDNWMCAIKDLVLDSGPANVFIVDWSGGSKPMLPIDYSASVSNTQYVGTLLGEFINVLNELAGQEDARNFHLIGHSLGAHICGFAGYYAHNLGRITGLDPAGPCFGTDRETSKEVASDSGQLGRGRRRLSPESAQLVVALHTDTSLFGLNENCAHYDVYVNGGFKQPKCASIDPTARFADLLQLNFKEAFNLNIACAHSYAHKLVNKFIGFVGANVDEDARNRRRNELIVGSLTSGNKTLAEGDDLFEYERCFPIAYECASWKAFRAGECGFCRDGSTRCVYTGLSLVNYQPSKQLDAKYDSSSSSSSEETTNKDEESDDYEFNDEDEELNEDESGQELVRDGEHRDGNKKKGQLIPSDKYSRGQHFIRSGSDGTTCLFHYQIIIASRKLASGDGEQKRNERKHYYYLHLPLELSGKLTNSRGERLHDRLVQVSHKLRPNSDAYVQVNSDYLSALRERQAEPQVTAEADYYDYYTTLITFKQAIPVDQCKGDATNGAGRKDKWHICKPLDQLLEARLWSSSGKKLEAVSWVALNYMSGVNYEQRARDSYIMTVAPNARVQSRGELDKEARAELNELEPEQSSGFFNRAASSADCLLSVFDTSDQAHAKRNFKCQRSSDELQYAIKLEPHKFLAAAAVST